MTVNSKIFSISTLNTIEHGPLTLNIKPHLDPPILMIYQIIQLQECLQTIQVLVMRPTQSKSSKMSLTPN